MLPRLKPRLLVLSLFLLATPALADLGPKPIRLKQTWDDPERLRLIKNSINIDLMPDGADVRACFLFQSSRRIRYYDRIRLEWAWPVPADWERPESLVAYSETILQMRIPPDTAPTLPEGGYWYMQDAPCFVPSEEQRREIREEAFEQIGIQDWLAFKDELVVYMPTDHFAVKVVVEYTQPYTNRDTPHEEFAYVLRTGALWKGSIDELAIRVWTAPGVSIVHSNWPLETGWNVWTGQEPTRDLYISVEVEEERVSDLTRAGFDRH